MTGVFVLALAMVLLAPSGAGARLTSAEPATSTALLDGRFTQGTVRVDNVPLHYVRGGSGPVLVLLHGWPQTWWEWHTAMPALARHFTVVAFDLPGLGDSGAPATGYDKATTARRIHDAVGLLGYRSVQLLTHDIGGSVGYDYARDFPSDVSRLIVIEIALSGFGLEDLYGLSWHFLFNSSPAPIPEQIMDNEDVPTYLGQIFDFSVNKTAIDRPVYYRAYGDPAKRTAGYNYYRAFPTDNADNQANAVAKRLTIPVLAMGGQYSIGPGVAASFRNVAADVREVVASNVGHFVPEENTQFVVDCANLFFGAVSGPPPSPELTNCAA